MWKLYDTLIEGIPDELVVEYDAIGTHRSLIHSGNTGIATVIDTNDQHQNTIASQKGRSLREVAKLSKSWDFSEAAFGMAAINSYYNSYEKLVTAKAHIWETGSKMGDVFQNFKSQIYGKKVAMIGHFEKAVNWMSSYCRLSVIEREPRDGDYPDSASEYLLQEQDFVFITGMTFTNKTLPRLLSLSQNAYVVLTGPSVPVTPILHQFGIDCISGFCVRNQIDCFNYVKSNQFHDIYKSGSKVILYNYY